MNIACLCHTAPHINVSISYVMGNWSIAEYLNLTCIASEHENLHDLNVNYQWTSTREDQELLVITENSQNSISIPLLNLSNAGRYTCHVIIETSLLNSAITASDYYDLFLNGKVMIADKQHVLTPKHYIHSFSSNRSGCGNS